MVLKPPDILWVCPGCGETTDGYSFKEAVLQEMFCPKCKGKMRPVRMREPKTSDSLKKY